jgi:amidase
LAIRVNIDPAAEYPSQAILEHDQELNLSESDYPKYTTHFRRAGRDGIGKILQEFNVNIILGPSDSGINVVAAASGEIKYPFLTLVEAYVLGYPIATLPLGYLDFNGRPHGLAAIAGERQERLLVQLQSAWEATFPKRKPPSMLER